MAGPAWNWRQQGFRQEPRRREARVGERVYRVWDGHRSSMRGSPKSVGVCFSSVAPRSRLDAERLFSVFEWGNQCTFLTEFLVPEKTMLWLGEADPGEGSAPFGLFCGPQIFIENPGAQHLVPGLTRRLENDLGHWRLHFHQGRDN